MEFNIDMTEFEEINSDFLTYKKNLIIEYLRKLNIMINRAYDNNLVDLKVYKGPFNKYGGTMMTWYYSKSFEVFVDENLDITNGNEILKTHEMLHLLCYIDDESLNYFGHNDIFIGIDEAVTQFLAEIIENKSEESYLTFLVDIIKKLANVFGIYSIITQYFKLSYDFENSFNNITKNKFDEFGIKMTNIYHLLLFKEYNKQNWNNEYELKLKDAQEDMIKYTNKIIDMKQDNMNTNIEESGNLHI